MNPWYQPNPFEELLKRFEARFQDLEGKLNAVNTVNSNPVIPNVPQGNQEDVPAPFISVNTIEEAWNHQDWKVNAGMAKRYFHNVAANEFYVKWYDVNIPKMFLKVYKEEAPKAEEEIQAPSFNVMELALGLAEKIEHIEGKLDKVVGLLDKPAKKRNEKGKFVKAEVVE